jgi:hypothetical protein
MKGISNSTSKAADGDPKAPSPWCAQTADTKKSKSIEIQTRYEGTVLRPSSSYINNQQTSSPAMWSPHRVPGYAHDNTSVDMMKY